MDFLFKLKFLNFLKGKHNKVTTHLLNILPKNNIFQNLETFLCLPSNILKTTHC